MTGPHEATPWIVQPLFEGGYESVIIEFTCHIAGATDVIQINAVAKELHTMNWITAQVPVARLSLTDLTKVGDWFAEFTAGVQRALSPF